MKVRLPWAHEGAIDDAHGWVEGLDIILRRAQVTHNAGLSPVFAKLA